MSHGNDSRRSALALLMVLSNALRQTISSPDAIQALRSSEFVVLSKAE